MNNNLSAWIRWSGYLAWVFLVMLVMGVLMVRAGSWQQGLLIYAVSGLVSLLLLALFAVQYLLPRFAEQRAMIVRRALPALPGSALLVMALVGGRGIPPIHDITTNPADPPSFAAVQDLRAADDNALDIDPDVIAQQLEAYPDLETIRSGLSYNDAYALALETAQSLGWEIVRDDVNGGFIEAFDTTAIMNFTDDVVIRVRNSGDGSAIDLRSASRVGVSDLGANAERIRAFAARFADSSGS
jgi:uncharacterized protein (DUF1499 family)